MYMAHPAWPVDLLRELLDRVVEETGASQAALAALISMDPSQISRWRSGKSRPSFDSLERFGDAAKAAYPALTVSTRELLAGAGYREALADTEARSAPARHPSETLPRIGDEDWWVTTAPDDLWLGVVWDDLTREERWVWHTPNTTRETRYRMVAMIQSEREVELRSHQIRRGADLSTDSRPSRDVNGR